MNVLITTRLHPVLINKFESKGLSCSIHNNLSRSDLEIQIPEFEGLIISSTTLVDKRLIDLGKSLKFIGRPGSGMEIIDVDYAASKGIQCFNSPEGNRDAVAEHAIGMLLALMNKLLNSDWEVRNKIWEREKNRGDELMGKTIAIIGYGNTGSAFARKLRGFDVRLLAYDKYKTGFGTEEIEETNMEHVFQEADVLSLHLPLTAETKYLANATYFNRFNKSIYLINTARGEIVRTEDLILSLKEGKIRAAALDVLENESLELYSPNEQKQFDELLKLPNVILSPHTAGWTKASYYKIAQMLADKILQSL